MNRPLEIPGAVRAAMAWWAHTHPKPMHDDCYNQGGACLQCSRGYPDLEWDGLNGCYYFWSAGMYHGVELDGTIHT